MADESNPNGASSSTGKERASKVTGFESPSPLPSKWMLWLRALPSLRNWVGGMLFGIALGVELDVALTKKLGWRPEDYKAHLLSSLLILVSLVVENLKLKKKTK